MRRHADPQGEGDKCCVGDIEVLKRLQRKSKRIRNQCVQLLLVLDEQNRDLDPELVESIDEMRAYVPL